jgi:hypothetical protein
MVSCSSSCVASQRAVRERQALPVGLPAGRCAQLGSRCILCEQLVIDAPISKGSLTREAGASADRQALISRCSAPRRAPACQWLPEPGAQDLTAVRYRGRLIVAPLIAGEPGHSCSCVRQIITTVTSRCAARRTADLLHRRGD